MTKDEAGRLAVVIGGVNDGCRHCIDDLCQRMTVMFPEFKWWRDADEEGDHIAVKQTLEVKPS